MVVEQDSFKIISKIEASKSGIDTGSEGKIKPLNILLVELVNPRFQLRNFPLQLFVLAGSIARYGNDGKANRLHDVTIAQSSSPEGVNDYIEKGLQTNRFVDVVGISAQHGNWDCLTSTLSNFREIPVSRRPHVILGGYLASHLHEKLLDDFADIPVTIAIEHGDRSFRFYIDEISLQGSNPNEMSDIPGIITPNRRLLIPSKSAVSDYPWLDGVPLASTNPNKVARMEISRGCFYNGCTFCVRPENQSEWVKYSLDDAVRQMADLAGKGYSRFTFSDEEIVGNDPQRFKELLLRIKELQTEFPDLEFYMNARTDNIVRAKQGRQEYLDDMWRLAKDAGVVMVWVGAESYSPRQLKIYNKGTGVSPQSNLESLRRLRSFGLSVVQGFIPFHPLMTDAELRENLEFTQRYKEDIVTSLDNPLGFLRVNPGTKYVDYVLREQKRQGVSLIKGFDPNTLSYLCAYLDPRLGLMVSFLYSLNALSRTGTKHIQWRGDTDQRLVQMRYINFDLLNAAYHCFTESTTVRSLETQLVTHLLPWYQKAVNEVEVDGVAEDFQDSFTHEFERNKSIFLR